MLRLLRYAVLTFILCCTFLTSHSQSAPKYALLQPADSLHPTRFWLSVGGGALIYSGFAYGLYQTWYKDYDLIGFHSFNDWGEWNQMDKMGHMLTAYTETRLVFGGARWTGMTRGQSRFTAALVGTFLQGTIEVMDGFSEKWGFSWGDMAFNTLGVSTFIAQDMLWQEQRIVLKVGNTFASYPDVELAPRTGETTITIADRGRELFGTAFAERFLKDYNTMTVWASANPRSFFPQSKWPSYLNIAVGMGADNLFGGYANSFIADNGNGYSISKTDYPRMRQYYISTDIDLTRIPTKKRWIKLGLSILNFVKIPGPALEYNSTGQFRWHWLYW